MGTAEKKLCTKCGITNPLSGFYIRRGSGKPSSWCKECIRAGSRARHPAPSQPGICDCGRELKRSGGSRIARACIVCRGLADECACGRPKSKGAKRCIACCRESFAARNATECPGCGGRKSYHALSCKDCMYGATRSEDREGYVKVKGADGRWRAEHVVVMEEYLGRSLLPGENVHHRNGIRNDNRLSNLELWTHKQPHGQRVIDLVAFAREILAQYDGYEDPTSRRYGLLSDFVASIVRST